MDGFIPMFHEGSNFQDNISQEFMASKYRVLVRVRNSSTLFPQTFLSNVYNTQNQVVNRFVENASDIAVGKVPVPVYIFDFQFEIRDRVLNEVKQLSLSVQPSTPF